MKRASTRLVLSSLFRGASCASIRRARASSALLFAATIAAPESRARDPEGDPATLLHADLFTAHSGIAWSFRFPSMGTLQNLGTSGRRRKREGLASDSCKDLRQKRHTIHLQPEVVVQNEPCLIVTPPSPDEHARSNPRYVKANDDVPMMHR